MANLHRLFRSSNRRCRFSPPRSTWSPLHFTCSRPRPSIGARALLNSKPFSRPSRSQLRNRRAPSTSSRRWVSFVITNCAPSLRLHFSRRIFMVYISLEKCACLLEVTAHCRHFGSTAVFCLSKLNLLKLITDVSFFYTCWMEASLRCLLTSYA